MNEHSFINVSAIVLKAWIRKVKNKFVCVCQDGGVLRAGLGQPLPPHLMEEQLMQQQQQMEEDQRWLEQEERLMVFSSTHLVSLDLLYSWLSCPLPFAYLSTF